MLGRDVGGVAHFGHDRVGVAGKELLGGGVARAEVVKAAPVGVGEQGLEVVVREVRPVGEVHVVGDGRAGEVICVDLVEQVALVVGELDVVRVLDVVEQVLRLGLLALERVVDRPGGGVAVHAEGERVADALAGVCKVVARDSHLAGRSGQAPLDEVGLVHAVLGRGAHDDGLAGVVHLGVGRLLPATLGGAHPIEGAKCVHVVVGEAQGRLHAHVVEALGVEVLVGREAQVLAGDGEAHEHRGAQHADGRDRDEAAQTVADGSKGVFCEG